MSDTVHIHNTMEYKAMTKAPQFVYDLLFIDITTGKTYRKLFWARHYGFFFLKANYIDMN